MKNFKSKFRILSYGITVVLLVYACQKDESSISDQPEEFNAIKLISDGANLGNTSFYFLPPMVSSPEANGIFDPTWDPEVVIYTLNNSTPVNPPLETFNSSNGLTMSLEDEHYKVNWHTNEYDLNEDITYQIQVLVDGIRIGYADVDVVSSGKELKNVNTGEYIPLKDGRTLPIKFRIEEGVLENNDFDEDGFISLVDCDDNDPLVNPGAEEIIYNGIDDDCDSSTLDDDLDQDGFNLLEDCNDNDETINPGVEEICDNGIDDDCDGEIDEGCIVVPDPIAYYPFNGNANDESGNGNDGTVSGATLTSDRFGNSNSAYNFDGIDDFIRITSAPENTLGTGDFTISVWFRSTSTDEGVIWNKRNTSSCSQASGPTTGMSQTSAGNGNTFTAFTRSTSTYRLYSQSAVSDGGWYNGMLVRSGNTLTMYLNGQVEESVNITPGINFATTLDLFIGRTIYCSGNYYDGDVDDFTIWDQALSEEVIDYLSNGI